MSDGLPTPQAHDGQAVFAAGSGRVRLIRNHELDLDIPGVTQKALGPKNAYDRAAPAGCTSSLYDLSSGRLLESFLVLNGTLDNCSGAHTRAGHAGAAQGDGPRASGGRRRLQMLAINGEPTYDTATGQRVGEVFDTHWVDIDEPDPSDAEDNPGSVYSQGRARGGCRFLGLEGSAWTQGGVTFVASEAGDSENGQVWRYVPAGHDGGRLQLLFESPNTATLNQPDTVGVSPAGRIANLAQVIEPLDLHYWDPDDFPTSGPTGASELAGAVFTPDGKHLFINVQYPGITCVVTGPF